MLIFNPLRIFSLRGIDRPNKFLVNNGFTSMIASRLLTYGLPNVKVSSVGRLCRLLNCTPNDLFDWKPDASDPIPAKHPLQSLVRQESSAAHITELLKDIPLEKLPDLHAMIEELRK
ncbi:MAG TPA: helix-turn-helix domain-containing protein [Pyrinomonadaceae bacterium]|nr:helix-turn-helix domain-containing protein [Pyrinomonadaceae bacterium]